MLRKMTPSELKIMEICWAASEPLSVYDIMDVLDQDSSGVQWKWQTVSTFLRRLMKKEYLSNITKGRTYFYSTSLTKIQYENLEAKDFLDNMFGGSLQYFLNALSYDKTGMDDKEIHNMDNLLRILEG